MNSQTGPALTVLTATRNAEKFLPGLFESLRAQTYRNFRWLVMDGLSSDGTVRMLAEYARREPWVTFVSAADFGFYHAINKGLAMTEGEYYLVAGADDLLEKDALRHYADAVSASGSDVIVANVIRGGRVIGGFHPEKSWIGHARVFRGSHSVGMLFRTDLHRRFGLYSKRFPLLADGYFLKLLLRSGKVSFHAADFVAGTFAEGGMTSVNKLQILAETWQIQMLTERHPLLQTLLFVGKIAVRFRAVKTELLDSDLR